MKQSIEVKIVDNYYTDEYELVIPDTCDPPLRKGYYIIKMDKPFPHGINDFPHRHMGGQEYFVMNFSVSQIRELKLNSIVNY